MTTPSSPPYESRLMDPQRITEELEHSGARNLLEFATLLRIQPQWARFFNFGAGRMPGFLQTLASEA